MIISASRRTDIPAFYSEWFFNRIHDGFADVINPFNRKQVSRISLKEEDVDCFVFWTKNAAPMLPFLNQLNKFAYYFQFTITPYNKDTEPGVFPKTAVIDSFKKLSKMIGKERVVWRYDPIFLSDSYNLKWHFSHFDSLLNELAPYTECCVISFLDLYKKTTRNTKQLALMEMGQNDMREIAAGFAAIAKGSGVKLQSCSEEIDLAAYGIEHGACIDKHRIEIAMNKHIDIKKDRTQRAVCGCMKSVDIGHYNTCLHLCRYCYANFDHKMVAAITENLNPYSTTLGGHLLGDEKITYRKVEHVKILPDYEETELLF